MYQIVMVTLQGNDVRVYLCLYFITVNNNNNLFFCLKFFFHIFSCTFKHPRYGSK
jgi:hypothetical protein